MKEKIVSLLLILIIPFSLIFVGCNKSVETEEPEGAKWQEC